VKPHAKYILAAQSIPISVALIYQQLHYRELKCIKGFEDNYEEKLLTKFWGEYHSIC
jgi:hypothetical protein